MLGAPRTAEVLLSNGTKVTIRELSIAFTWPYINGEAVDPSTLIRASVIDPSSGEPAIAEDEGIPMAQALELLPQILKLAHLEAESVPEVAALKRDFPLPASAG